jgi:SAM-dependent methyltransferase
MSMIHYYNQNAEKFYQDTINVDMSDFYKPFLELLHSNSHILDAGCGSGRDSLYFLRRGYKVTALDASEELAKIASQLISQPVLNISFQQIKFENEFDGIWASASLLHINSNEIDDVLQLLAKSLKQNGILYCSFKYGNKEYEKDGRYFNCYDEDSITRLLEKQKDLSLYKTWKSNDQRPNRKEEIWLNCLIKKTILF